MSALRRRAAALVAVAAIVLAAPVLGPAAPAGAAPGPPSAPQWWFDDWDVPGLWANGARGQSITIALIDSGVNAAVPELAGKLLPGRDMIDPQTGGTVDHFPEPFGHGTAMASLMVAEPGLGDITGLAPDARVLPITVPLGELGESEPPTADPIPTAIRWAVDSGAKIISLSLGYVREEATDLVPCAPARQDAILYALAKGAIVVAASGNDGEDGSPVLDPGVCIGVVAVGAVDRSGAVAPFSSRHPYLTVTAPGVEIPTLGRIPGEAFIGQGTSQATAITSAALALVWSKHPDLTNHQVVSRVLATLDQRVTTPTPDPAYGYGVLDAGAAVTADVPLDAPNPLLDAAEPFLEQSAAALAEDESPPEPVAVAAEPPGEVVVGTPPTVITPTVIGGAAFAGVGLLGLVALAALAVRGRRHRSRADAPIAA
jgi:subtilisin family serine protease